MELDPWQEHVLRHSLGEHKDGSWAAFEVGIVVPRQNGKGSLLEARELAGLFLLGERLMIHSAHQFDTSLEGFRRLLHLVEWNPDLSRFVKRVSKSHGEEGIELMSGQRLRFRTRTKGGGRGFTGDWLGLDEAMVLPESGFGALLPTLSARPNPQVWYTASAVDQEVHEHGLVLARVRARAIAGEDPKLAYFEWSADGDIREPERFIDDREAWAQANPGLGIRISTEHVATEQRAMAERTFAVERLGVGDWPDPDIIKGAVINLAAWMALDSGDPVETPEFVAFDVTPDRSITSIAAACRDEDGFTQIEIIERRAGTGWVVEWLTEFAATYPKVGIACDMAGPAASLTASIEKAQIELVDVSAKDHARACGMFFDAVQQGTLRHLGTRELTSAVKGAVKRPLIDAWAWSRKSSTVDISPLVAVTLALWGLDSQKPAKSAARAVDLSAL